MRCRIVVAAAVVCAAVVTVTAAPSAAQNAVTVSGTRTLHDPPFPEELLPSYFVDYTVTHIGYPAAVFGMDSSLAIAVGGIAEAVDTAAGALLVAGFSQGAVAVAYEKRRLMALPIDQRPTSDRLTFVTIGDPAGPGGIMRFLPGTVPLLDLSPVRPPDTPYASLIVNGEYDAYGDFPDRPWNLISVANALLGIVYVHGRYETVSGGLDLTAVPERNITVTTNAAGGTTTTYLLPTPRLPLVQPLRDIGVPESVVVALEKPLKAAVDAGYVRNDPTPATAKPPSRPAAARPSAVRRPTVSRADAAATRTARPGPERAAA